MTETTDPIQDGSEPERSTASEVEEQRRRSLGSLSEQAGGALGMPETTPIHEEGVPPTGPDIAGEADMFGGTTGVTSTGATTEDIDEGPGIK